MNYYGETKQRFGIRKFSIGVGSVLLGTMFMTNPIVANAQGTTTSEATGTGVTSTTGSESYIDYLKLELIPGNTKTEFFADESIINEVKVTLEGINQASQELYLEYEVATKSPVVTTSTKEVTGVAPTEVEIAEIGSYIHHKSQRYEMRNGERYHINTYHQKIGSLISGSRVQVPIKTNADAMRNHTNEDIDYTITVNLKHGDKVLKTITKPITQRIDKPILKEIVYKESALGVNEQNEIIVASVQNGQITTRGNFKLTLPSTLSLGRRNSTEDDVKVQLEYDTTQFNITNVKNGLVDTGYGEYLIVQYIGDSPTPPEFVLKQKLVYYDGTHVFDFPDPQPKTTRYKLAVTESPVPTGLIQPTLRLIPESTSEKIRRTTGIGVNTTTRSSRLAEVAYTVGDDLKLHVTSQIRSVGIVDFYGAMVELPKTIDTKQTLDYIEEIRLKGLPHDVPIRLWYSTSENGERITLKEFDSANDILLYTYDDEPNTMYIDGLEMFNTLPVSEIHSIGYELVHPVTMTGNRLETYEMQIKLKSQQVQDVSLRAGYENKHDNIQTNVAVESKTFEAKLRVDTETRTPEPYTFYSNLGAFLMPNVKLDQSMRVQTSTIGEVIYKHNQIMRVNVDINHTGEIPSNTGSVKIILPEGIQLAFNEHQQARLGIGSTVNLTHEFINQQNVYTFTGVNDTVDLSHLFTLDFIDITSSPDAVKQMDSSGIVQIPVTVVTQVKTNGYIETITSDNLDYDKDGVSGKEGYNGAVPTSGQNDGIVTVSDTTHINIRFPKVLYIYDQSQKPGRDYAFDTFAVEKGTDVSIKPTVTNTTDEVYRDMKVVTVLSHQNDRTFNFRSARGTEFTPRLVRGSIQKPDGWTVEVTTQAQTGDAKDITNWEALRPDTDYSQITAIRWVSNPGTELGVGQTINFGYNLHIPQDVDGSELYTTTAISVNGQDQQYLEGYRSRTNIIDRRVEQQFGTVIIRYQDEYGNEIKPDIVHKDNVLVNTMETIAGNDFVKNTPTGEQYDTRPHKDTVINYNEFTYEYSHPKDQTPEFGELQPGETIVTYVYRATPKIDVKHEYGSVKVRYEDVNGVEIKPMEIHKDNVRTGTVTTTTTPTGSETQHEPSGEMYDTTPLRDDVINYQNFDYNFLRIKDDTKEQDTVNKGETVITYVYEVVPRVTNEAVIGSVIVRFEDQFGNEIHEPITLKDGVLVDMVTTTQTPDGTQQSNAPTNESYNAKTVKQDTIEFQNFTYTYSSVIGNAIEEGIVPAGQTVITYVYNVTPKVETTVTRGTVIVRYEDRNGRSIKDEVILVNDVVVNTKQVTTTPQGQEVVNTPSNTTYDTTQNRDTRISFQNNDYVFVTRKDDTPEQDAVKDGHTVITYVYDQIQKFQQTHEFVTDEDITLPEALKQRVENKNVTNLEAGSTYAVNPDIDVTDFTDEINDGTWKFEAWDYNEQTVQDKDIHFVGKWLFEPNTYRATFEFKSKRGDALPSGVMDQLPQTREELVNTVKVNVFGYDLFYDAETDKYWAFISWDHEEQVVNKANLHFVGVWESAPRAWYTTFEFQSATPGKELPAGIVEMTPIRQVDLITGDKVFYQTFTTVETTDGTWTFKQWDRESVTINKGNEHIVGYWEFTERPYEITHVFKKAEGIVVDLPSGLLERLNNTNLVDLKNGTTHTPNAVIDTTDYVDTVNDGTWTFVTWDKADITIDNANGQFTGEWRFTPQTYKVTHEFVVKGDPNGILPISITERLRDMDYDGLVDKTMVTPNVAIQTTSVYDVMGKGTWVFDSWDKTTDTINRGDVHFVGSWTFVGDTYELTHVFKVADGVTLELPDVIKQRVEGKDRSELPNGSTQEVDATIDTTHYYDDVNDGVWSFVSWDKTSLTIQGQNGKFIGEWLFAPTVYESTYEFVSATPGKDLPEVIVSMTPEIRHGHVNGEVVTVVTPDTTEVKVDGGKWVFINWKQTEQTIKRSDVHFIGSWEFVTDEVVTPPVDKPEPPVDVPTPPTDTPPVVVVPPVVVTPPVETPKTPVKETPKQELPQTGSAESHTALLGAAFVALGLVGMKRKEDN